MLTRSVLCLAAACAIACGSESETNTPAEGGGGAGGGAGGEGGDVVALVPCSGDIAWSDSTALGSPRDHHATFVMESSAGPFLYVAGGNNYSQVFGDVFMAPIGDDGLLGAWQATEPLPSARAGTSVVVRAPYAIVFGGRTSQSISDIPDAVVATVGADGHITSWVAGAPMPEYRFHLSAALSGDTVFVTGGLRGSTSSDTVFMTELGADGMPAMWQILAPMTRPRSHHASFVHGGYLYVAGGLDGNPAGSHVSLADVERAAIIPGGLGPWEPAGDIGSAVATHSASIHGDCVLMPGGIDDGHGHSAVVRRADLLAGGALGPWTEVPTAMPTPRSHTHQAPIHNGRMYLVGGSIGAQDVTDGAIVGTLE